MNEVELQKEMEAWKAHALRLAERICDKGWQNELIDMDMPRCPQALLDTVEDARGVLIHAAQQANLENRNEGT